MGSTIIDQKDAEYSEEDVRQKVKTLEVFVKGVQNIRAELFKAGLTPSAATKRAFELFYIMLDEGEINADAPAPE
jgi:hypothetical protein